MILKKLRVNKHISLLLERWKKTQINNIVNKKRTYRLSRDHKNKKALSMMRWQF